MDETSVGFTYWPSGRRKTAVDARGTTAYTYDARDRLTVLEYPDGKRPEYGYDQEGRRTTLTAVVGGTRLTTGYRYDSLDRIAEVTDPGSRVFGMEYDDVGSLAKLVRPNGVETAYTHDPLNRLTNIRTYSRSPDATLASYAYALGPTGIRTRIEKADGTVREYQYDGLYRLTKETVTGTQPYEKSFTCDEVSNRKTQTSTALDGGAGGGTIDYGHDNRDRLETEGKTVYTWSDNGNLVEKSGETPEAVRGRCQTLSGTGLVGAHDRSRCGRWRCRGRLRRSGIGRFRAGQGQDRCLGTAPSPVAHGRQAELFSNRSSGGAISTEVASPLRPGR